MRNWEFPRSLSPTGTVHAFRKSRSACGRSILLGCVLGTAGQEGLRLVSTHQRQGGFEQRLGCGMFGSCQHVLYTAGLDE